MGLTYILIFMEVDPRISDPRQAAYMLATTRHETYNPHTKSAYHPITELGSKSYFTKYDGRADLGNSEPGDGYRFRGRGYVQTTGRKNYEKLTKAYNVFEIDFVKNPDLLLEQEYSYFAMSYCMTVGMYTRKKLSDYINDRECDYYQARRIINRLDKADKIAAYATLIEQAFNASIIPVASSPEPEKPSEPFSPESPAGASDPNPLISHDSIITPPAAPSDIQSSVIPQVPDKVKEIASTGLTSIGNKITSGSVTAGTLAAAQAFVKQNWMFLAFAAFLILVGLGVWIFIYHVKHKEKLVQATINADKSKNDVEFTK